jgi:hypothetical protein
MAKNRKKRCLAVQRNARKMKRRHERREKWKVHFC